MAVTLMLSLLLSSRIMGLRSTDLKGPARKEDRFNLSLELNQNPK